jgi:hypothetical protein
VAALAVPVLLAGVPGLVAGAVGAVAGRLGRWAPVAVGGLVLLAGLVRCVDPLPGRAGWIDAATRLLVLVAVAAVLSRPVGRPGATTGRPAAPPGGR